MSTNKSIGPHIIIITNLGLQLHASGKEKGYIPSSIHYFLNFSRVCVGLREDERIVLLLYQVGECLQYSCGTGMLYTGYYFHGYILCFQRQIWWFADHLLVQNLCIRCMVTSSRDVHRTLTEERQSVAHTREYLREQQRGLKRRRTALQHAHHKWSDNMKTFRTRQVCKCVCGRQLVANSKLESRNHQRQQTQFPIYPLKRRRIELH